MDLTTCLRCHAAVVGTPEHRDGHRQFHNEVDAALGIEVGKLPPDPDEG